MGRIWHICQHTLLTLLTQLDHHRQYDPDHGVGFDADADADAVTPGVTHIGACQHTLLTQLDHHRQQYIIVNMTLTTGVDLNGKEQHESMRTIQFLKIHTISVHNLYLGHMMFTQAQPYVPSKTKVHWIVS